MIEGPTISIAEARRKIIQIAACSGAFDSDESCFYLPCVVALCDDGSIWMKPEEKDWYKLPDIPQDPS